ncbi:hypothetical protein VNO77_42687 [Canavalia gladiata]|uniref:BHLH domain-containing protein n=1 Tax=Canavalia gladiata TaxID=3824 RepID=A0AAN9JV65_CANGL
MQGINSLLNPSEISVQIQNSQMNQLNSSFHPSSHDDFLDQMLSSCSWPDLNPNKPFWDPHNSSLSDETTPFPYEDHSTLASKLRNHQISASTPTSKAMALMLHQQLLMSRGASTDSTLLQMPLSLPPPNDVVHPDSFKSPNPAGEASVQPQPLYNGFAKSPHATTQASNHTQHFQNPQGSSNPTQGSGAGGTMNQATATQTRPRVRARRGQATDPHSIAERLRRERIAERMKALQELVPNANKTDKASMLDEIIDYVKFLQLQVKVLSMSRLGGAAAVAPLVADMSSEGGDDCIQGNGNSNGGGALGRNSNNQTTTSTSNDSLTMTEHQVAKLMEEDMGSAMQYLQGKGLCLMPISLATAISTATCHTRNPLINGNNQIQNNKSGGSNNNANPTVTSNGEGPSSPSMSVLTVQSAVVGNDIAVKDAASVSKP